MSEIPIGSVDSQLFLRLKSGLSANLVSGYVKGVFPTYPNPAAKDFPGYPIIVIRTSNDFKNVTYSGLKLLDVDATMTCYGASAQSVNEAIDRARNVLVNDLSIGINDKKFSTSVSTSAFVDGNVTIHQKDLKMSGKSRQWQ